MKLALGMAAGVLAIGLTGCVSDGYYGSDYGYGYGPGAPSVYGYGADVNARTCVRRERVWDPYLERRVTVRRAYPC
jgi:hypothetical protein